MIPSVDQVAFSRAVLCNSFSCLLCASRSVTAEGFSVRVRTRAVSAGKRVYRPADTPRTLHIATEERKEVTYNSHNYFALGRIATYGAIAAPLPSN